MDEGEVVARKPVEACCEAAQVPELVQPAFDAVAEPVDERIVGDRGPHNSQIQHQVLVVPVPDQIVEHLLPDPRRCPAAEALMRRLPIAIALWRVLPVGAGSQHPEHPVHKQPVVGPRPTGSDAFPGSSGSIRADCASSSS